MLPRFALAEEAGLLEFVEAAELAGRHLFLLFLKDLVHLRGGGEGGVEDEVAEILRVLEGIGLGENAAATVAQQVDLTEVESDAEGFDVFDIGLDGVLVDIFKAFGAAGAALVEEDEAVGAGEREEPGQEVVVGGAGAAVEDDERSAGAEADVVEEHAVGVHVALLRIEDGGRLGAGGKGDRQSEEEREELLHGDHGTPGRACTKPFAGVIYPVNTA